MAKIGITTINMYCDMVKEQFAPILSELRSRNAELRSKIEIEVKKELGIYDLYVKEAQLKVQLAEIARQLKGWQTQSHTPSGYLNPIEEKVKVIMNKSKNGLMKDVEKEMYKMMYAIKLSGIDSNIKTVFDKLPEIIKKFTEKIAKLPPPTRMIT